MLRRWYKRLNLPVSVRNWLRETLPLRFRRPKTLRHFGSINELYFWRSDSDFDTIAPIQNFYSSVFPDLDTSTVGRFWVFNSDGQLIASKDFNLCHSGMCVVKLSEIASPQASHGTFMWNIQIPKSVAEQRMISSSSIYFTDRGYICYEKHGSQPAFMHGVDRYAVFQYPNMESTELFYAKPEKNRSWTPEFPIASDMQNSIDVVLVNRTGDSCKYKISVRINGGEIVSERRGVIAPRGCALVELDAEVLSELGGLGGYFTVDGLSSTWGRPAIFRHYQSGAVSVMHC